MTLTAIGKRMRAELSEFLTRNLSNARVGWPRRTSAHGASRRYNSSSSSEGSSPAERRASEAASAG